MRTITDADPLPTLVELVREPKPEPKPQQIKPGIVRNPDGRLETVPIPTPPAEPDIALPALHPAMKLFPWRV